MNVLVLTCAAGLLAVGCTGAGESSLASASNTSLASNAAPISSTLVSTPSPATPVATERAAPTEELKRPITAPEVCTSYAAEEQSWDDDAGPLTLFALPSDRPVAIQVVASPTDGPAGPFAVVQRFFDRDDPPRQVEPLVIDDTEFFLSEFDNGNAEATWSLPDGSQGHVRARGLSPDTLIEILASAVPRPIDDPVPGFDFAAVQTMELVVDQLNTDRLTGSASRSQCRVADTGDLYSIWVVRGDGLSLYASVIDRPPPVDVGYENDAVVIVAGPDVTGGPVVADVENADLDAWERLLDNG